MRDYSLFFNINESTFDEIDSIRIDFLHLVCKTLRELNCNEYYLNSISSSLFWSMVSEKTFYHTPVHILSIFQFMETNKIDCTPEQRLALLFHDAIYRPGSRYNESSSARFMHSLLLETGVNETTIHKAEIMIEHTAFHLYNGPYHDSELVMDLDMSGFAASRKSFDIQDEMIEKEFSQPKLKGYGYSELEFLKGRIDFLKKLKARPTIYRTEYFKRFELIAQTNLKSAIVQTTDRLENLEKK